MTGKSLRMTPELSENLSPTMYAFPRLVLITLGLHAVQTVHSYSIEFYYTLLKVSKLHLFISQMYIKCIFSTILIYHHLPQHSMLYMFAVWQMSINKDVWIYVLFIVHPRRGVVYNFGRFCLSVSLSDDNFWNPWHRKFIFAHLVQLQGVQVKFVYKGHQVKVKATGAKKVHSHPVFLQRKPECQQESGSPQCENSIANNCASVTHRAVKCACMPCSTRFSATADRMAWPPSLLCDWK